MRGAHYRAVSATRPVYNSRNVTYRFGGFTLDTGTRELLLDREEVHLSPKAFDLLTLLLVNRPRAVAKAELQERLWPSTFVEETNLAGLIAEIRRCLQDDAVDPTFVRTVHRFGYRFVGEVVEGEPAADRAPAQAGFCLIVDARQIRLLAGANIIGRESDATIRCDAPGVSRHHARIVTSEAEAIVEDLESKNGTYVNGSRVTSARLSDGDEIRLGTMRMTFRVAVSSTTTETVATNDRK
jgi:DNA-binding winged helix-turn-helix (wHTH) protein